MRVTGARGRASRASGGGTSEASGALLFVVVRGFLGEDCGAGWAEAGCGLEGDEDSNGGGRGCCECQVWFGRLKVGVVERKKNEGQTGGQLGIWACTVPVTVCVGREVRSLGQKFVIYQRIITPLTTVSSITPDLAPDVQCTNTKNSWTPVNTVTSCTYPCLLTSQPSALAVCPFAVKRAFE